MPQRNSQNPNRGVRMFKKPSQVNTDKKDTRPGASRIAGHCLACNAEVPAKPGFRFSSLTCPKCGASMKKK